MTQPNAFAVMERALSASIKEADRRSLRQLRAFAESNDLSVELHAAGPQSEIDDVDLFDPEFMQGLFEKGEADAQGAYGIDR